MKLIESLSILLPTYNCDCRCLVEELHKQCSSIDSLDFEIVVADDGSSDKSFIEKNQVITKFPEVRYLLREKNSGRAAIRNFLTREALKKWILFIDGDLSLDNPDYIRKYIESNGDVVVGGITIAGYHPDNLRWRYEKECEEAHSLKNRREKKLELHTNFLVRRKHLFDHPFDERFRKYGYEDVLLGKQLVEAGLSVHHIDNPVVFDKYESNEHYLHKCEEALQTLWKFRSELKGYSRILVLIEKFKKIHILVALHLVYQLIHTLLISRIISNKPSIYAFNIYKMLYFAHLAYQNEHS